MKPSEDSKPCQTCGLFQGCRHPFMKPTGAQYNPKLMVIGEAPGEEEDREGKPFVGRSGQLLRQVLAEIGFDPDQDVMFSNVVRCHPPNNKIVKRNITLCKQYVLDEIDEYKPEMVFLMGNSPLNGVLGESGITDWNGSIVKQDGRLIVPLYHPAYILRDMSKMDEWLEAMLKVVDGDEEKQPEFERSFPSTLADISTMYEYLNGFENITYDVETTGLDAFSNHSAIVSVGLLAGERSFSFPLYHPEANWTDQQMKRIVTGLGSSLNYHSGHVLGHHTKFDLMWTFGFLGYWFDIGGDTMLISHLLDSRQGIHGLKRLAGVYLGKFEYGKGLTLYKRAHPEADPERGGSYANVPLEILLPYGAMDVENTTLLERVLYPKLDETQRMTYHKIVIPTSNLLARIQSNGLEVDKYVADRYAKIYSMNKGDYLDEVMADSKVKAMIKARQIAMDTAAKEDLARRRAIKPHAAPKKRQVFTFNPNSPNQLRELFFQKYKLPVLAVSDKTKQPSTSSKLYRPLEDDYPILKSIRMYKLMGKMLGTYLVPASTGVWTSDDGRVHTTYNQHGTVTGRLSSSQPVNLQNIPTPEKEPGTLLEYLPIKNIFTHRDWDSSYYGIDIAQETLDEIAMERATYHRGALVQWDYSAMEIRVFASCAKCEPMLNILRLGVDPHYSVSALAKRLINRDDLVNIDKAELENNIFPRITKPERYRYKWTNWTLLYGGNAVTLSRTYNIPLDEAEETVEIYYDIFPEVLDFQKWAISFAQDHGYIESPFGRREWLPYINEARDAGKRNADCRAAVNMPIQSAASDTLLIAGNFLMAMMDESQMRSVLVNTVHDSLVADCPYEEIINVAETGIYCMENVKKLAQYHYPEIPFDWLLAPLKADADVGTHYGTKMDLDKWKERLWKEYGYQRVDKAI